MPSLQYVDNAVIQPAIEPALEAIGWTLASIGGQEQDTLHNPELDLYLAQGGTLRFRITGESFSCGDQDLINAVVESAIANGKAVFNSAKIRVSGDPSAADVVELSPTDYFQGLATNEIGFKTAMLSDGRRVNGTELAFPGNVIPSLARSKLSNHIGACALAFDTDGVVSLVRTSKSSMIAAQKISPSAAGSADIEDFHGRDGDLLECVLAGLKRELVEEQGIAAGDITNARVIGFQRYLPRGGKPEFIGLLRIGETWKSARKGVSNEETLFTNGHVDLNCAELGIRGLQAWLQENDTALSFSVRQCFWSLFNLAATDDEFHALVTA